MCLTSYRTSLLIISLHLAILFCSLLLCNVITYSLIYHLIQNCSQHAAFNQSDAAANKSEPAANKSEFDARMELIKTQSMRIKKSKHPQPFQIISPNIVQNGDFERVGERVGNVEGYSCVLLDVLCAPLRTGKMVHLNNKI